MSSEGTGIIGLKWADGQWHLSIKPYMVLSVNTEAATRGVLCEKVFLKFRRIHRQASVSESLF